MTDISRWVVSSFCAMVVVEGCSRPTSFIPTAVVDLGALVTDDLPQRFWGPGLLKAMKFTKQNSAEIVHWAFPLDSGDTLKGQNSYYTFFNHGGPHVDAPIHVGAGGGL